MSSNPDNATGKRYRIVAMLPTEMYVDSDDIETAIETVNWLKAEYPGVEYPLSPDPDVVEIADARPVIICVHETYGDADDTQEE